MKTDPAAIQVSYVVVSIGMGVEMRVVSEGDGRPLTLGSKSRPRERGNKRVQEHIHTRVPESQKGSRVSTSKLSLIL